MNPIIRFNNLAFIDVLTAAQETSTISYKNDCCTEQEQTTVNFKRPN